MAQQRTGRGRLARVTVGLVAWAAVGSAVSWSDSGEYLSVVVRQGQTIREIAAEYLDDPNLWMEILRASEIASPERVRPGVTLRVPRNEVSEANASLVAAQEAVRRATGIGARVFAPALLQEALDTRERALLRRRESDWGDCLRWALEARALADQAAEQALEQRNASGQAVLEKTSGQVQTRRDADLIWGSARAGAVLIERERVRTLSESTAEILFLDESLLRLVPNSQAVIQKMRVDRLNRRQDTSVSLEEGDVYALLSGSGAGRGVGVKVPGVTIDSASTDFWMSRQGPESKFANYDDRKMDVTSAGSTVVLRQNEGTRVTSGNPPEPARKLLAAPRLLQPADEAIESGKRPFDVRWSVVAGAASYQLEVSTDPAFERVVRRLEGLEQPEAQVSGLDDGTYSWRVRAVDRLGFPGEQSRIRRIRLQHDAAAPYLLIQEPQREAIVRESPISVRGVVEPRSRLLLNGEEVAIASDGSFSELVELSEERTVLRFEAQASNGLSTGRERIVTYLPAQEVPLELDPAPGRSDAELIRKREGGVVLSGRTAPRARIDVLGTAIGTYASDTGQFQLRLGPAELGGPVRLRILAPSGLVLEKELRVSGEADPPEVVIPDPPPLWTNTPRVRLAGRVSRAESLRLNGRAVPIEDGAFETEVELEPGLNALELVAMGRGGHHSRWQREIRLDVEPPRYLSSNVSRSSSTGGSDLEIRLRAQDDSGLQRFARLELQAGSERVSLWLTLEPETGTYRGIYPLSPALDGSIRLKSVTLRDHAGNETTYPLP